MIRLVLITLFAGLALAGCDCRFSQSGSEQPTTGGLGADLVILGRALLWIGAGAVVVGLASRFAILGAGLIGRIPVVGPILTGSATFIASIGALAFVTGCAVRWLADNLWVFWATIGATAVAWALLHRNDLRRWMVGRPPTGR